ncbi:beta-N-acetylhexosaminidase [Ructibacterium gallinarum]|uniref:beta-N-acetylhexosaminidase n=1 Tax=Ructibacterium gallinarum TaxID=2779355 RepID=A0A9D5RCS9_9FIRM|nr:beta-N-acetylhexosaminidase [Ructibacterium gallinarum]MBE5041278.1 beta-N-acetylhexosaminidase [Ructibacterium gallinarum]
MKQQLILLVLAVSFLLIMTGCGNTQIQSGTPAGNEISQSQIPQEDAKTPTYSASSSFRAQAEEILKTMTLEEKVWQMFFVRPEDITGIGVAIQAGETTQKALEQYPVGGLVYFSQNIKSREQLVEMIQNSQSYSKLPLFISVDEEGGRVARLGDADIGVTQHPPMAQVGAGGDPGRAEEIGRTLGRELKELGFNMDFAPVADIITVDSNEDIGDRSFGKDPEIVAQMVAAEVQGLQSQGISATLKHFPSNGSTSANTHEEMGVCTRTLEEMRNAEFIPFRAGIEAGADLVMVAHMAAVNLSGDNTPATLSKAVIMDFLRNELGFSGVIISDALNMGAITNHYTAAESAVAAVNAGVDLLLMSPDAKSAAQEILNQVKDGTIQENRINESVRRILELKLKRGIL